MVLQENAKVSVADTVTNIKQINKWNKQLKVTTNAVFWLFDNTSISKNVNNPLPLRWSYKGDLKYVWSTANPNEVSL